MIFDEKYLLVKYKYLMSFKLINLKVGIFDIEVFIIGVFID